MKKSLVLEIIVFVSLSLIFTNILYGAEPDTLKVLDTSAAQLGAPPQEWVHVFSKKQRLLTNYSIERSIDGPYMRVVSNASNSALEIDLGEIDPKKYGTLAWRWKVDKFPKAEWEEDKNNIDFAIRIEVVCDFKGSYKNPLNLVRKGLITSLFRRYPPELVLTYVWSIKTPTGRFFTSPESKRTTILPVESTDMVKGVWLSESRNILEDLKTLEMSGLVIKKIRVRADTDNTSSSAESGVKYIYLIKSD